MVNVCRENGVALAVNCARRWNPFFSEARRLIDAGELGELLQVTVYAQCAVYPITAVMPLIFCGIWLVEM